MNATCLSNTCETSVGVTESLQKPRYTVARASEAFEIEVELPGVPKSAVTIDLEEDILTIRGERQVTTPESWKPLHRELSTRAYQLRLRVNTPVEEDKLTAALEDGVLKLTLPLKAAAKARRIDVQ